MAIQLRRYFRSTTIRLPNQIVIVRKIVKITSLKVKVLLLIVSFSISVRSFLCNNFFKVCQLFILFYLKINRKFSPLINFTFHSPAKKPFASFLCVTK